MDLYAYANIGTLEEIAKENGISIPRLRGYRLMSQEEPVSKADLEEIIQSDMRWECEQWCCSHFFERDYVEYSSRTDRIRKRYLLKESEEGSGIRWDRIHGKRRKKLKYAIKRRKRRVLAQFEAFNKYAGRSDVLYIHARIGGRNWETYGGKDLEKQPWFLEKVNDHFDGTYCDIYAKIEDRHGEGNTDHRD